MARHDLGKLLRLRLSRLGKDGDGLFCLPLGFRDVLLDISERLTWARTWELDNGDPASLTDDDWQKIELGIWRLTDMCEIVINNIIEVPPAPITVVNTNNCGGGGGCCTQIPVPTSPDGTPFPLAPIDPSDPLGENVPTWDDENQVPPDGYDDYPTFMTGRCRSANWMVDSFIQFVKDADLAERKISAGGEAAGVIYDIAMFILALLPGPVADWAGWLVILKWAAALVGGIAAAADELENLNDWLQLASDGVIENRQELVCAVYSMTSVEWFDEFFLTFFAGHISPELEAEGASPALVNVFRNLFAGLAHNLAVRAYNAVAGQSIPESYVPPTDCAECEDVAGLFDLPEGYVWAEVKFQIPNGEGSDFTNFQYNPIANNQLLMSVDAHNGDFWFNVPVEVETEECVALIVFAQGSGFADNNKAIPCAQRNGAPSCPGTTSTQRRPMGYWGRHYTEDIPQEIIDNITALPLAYINQAWPEEIDKFRVGNYPINESGLEITLTGWYIVKTVSGGGGSGAG